LTVEGQKLGVDGWKELARWGMYSAANAKGFIQKVTRETQSGLTKVELSSTSFFDDSPEDPRFAALLEEIGKSSSTLKEIRLTATSDFNSAHALDLIGRCSQL